MLIILENYIFKTKNDIHIFKKCYYYMQNLQKCKNMKPCTKIIIFIKIITQILRVNIKCLILKIYLQFYFSITIGFITIITIIKK